MRQLATEASMLPSEPPRTPGTGFLYFPPYRVQGYSIAGEETVVQIPELDVCFDIGRAPRHALTSPYVALSHGHMDHVAGLAYYFSQRYFQGMGTGTVICHPSLAKPIQTLMGAWADVEAQHTPHQIIPLEPEAEHEIKNNFYLRAFETVHTVPSLGYSIVEKRSKLREELVGLPQSKLVELKNAGQEITYTREVPQVTFMGDTAPGSHFERPEVVDAKILITECTFLEGGHRERAQIGKHLHLADLQDLMPKLNCEAIVITHLSRRTHLRAAREALETRLTPEQQERVFLLMDSRTNRDRYRRQVAEAEAAAAAKD
jgi:ribonuclease Z